MSNTTISITKLISMQAEELTKLSLPELSELHSIASESKQKKANRKADLIAGIINAKKSELKAKNKAVIEKKKAEAEAKAESEETKAIESFTGGKVLGAEETEEVKEVFAENSAKPKAVAKPKAKPIAKPKAKPEQKQPEEQKEDQTEQPEEKQPEQPTSLKREKKVLPDFSKMSPEQIQEYVLKMQAETSTFPETIEAGEITFNQVDFESVKDIQKQLIEKPMTLYLFCDERLDDNLTQFLVLFANTECIVLLDRNREKNTTLTISPKQLTATHISIKEGKSTKKFEYSFYTRG